MVNKKFFLENGNYIPILSLFTYYITNDLFLSCILYLKLFPANFYYFFGDLYDYLPEGYNFLIQFVKFFHCFGKKIIKIFCANFIVEIYRTHQRF